MTDARHGWLRPVPAEVPPPAAHRATGMVGYPHHVPFLLNVLNARILEKAVADFAPFGVTVQEARLLIAVLFNPGIRVGPLASLTCIEMSTVSHMLRRMHGKKLIVRTRVEDDNRSVAVDLTLEGSRVARGCHQAALTHEAHLFGAMPPERAELLRTLLVELYDEQQPLQRNKG